MAEVGLSYWINKDLTGINLDYISKLSKNFKRATEFIEKSYSKVSVDNVLDIYHIEAAYFSTFAGEKEEIKSSIRDFINICGIPNFVRGDSELVEKCLDEKGKCLKRKFSGAAVGKHVVDKK